MSTLAEPDFISRDPKVIEAEVFQTWEDEGGPPLQPGQVEALFLKVIAYRESLVRIGVQDAAKSQLLRFTKYPVVDYLGELLQTPRLPAEGALTTLRWWLDAAHGEDVPIESGTRGRTKDGRFYFATQALATVAAGALYVDVLAKCTVAGSEANGYLAGQVSEIVDPTPLVTRVENISATADGAPPETTANYVERLLVAPDAQSSAGSEEAYKYFARSASSAVTDVAVQSPDAGDIRLVVLSSSGVPSGELLTLVAGATSGKKVRPLTDTVAVDGATAVDWTLEAQLTLFANTDADSVVAASLAVGEAYAALRKAKLHRSAALSQINKSLSVSGVYSVAIINPPADVLSDEDEYLDCASVSVTFAGYSTEEATTDE